MQISPSQTRRRVSTTKVSFGSLSCKQKLRRKREGKSPLLLSRFTGLTRIYGQGLSCKTREFKAPRLTTMDKFAKGLRKRKFGSPDAAALKAELIKDVKVGGDALGRLAGSSWWSWDAGSTHLFWRWPKRYQKSIRDGTPVFIHKGKLKAHFSRQRWPSDPLHKNLMGEKSTKLGNEVTSYQEKPSA